MGNITKEVDPKGRETTYQYATNGIDLSGIFQKNGGALEQMASFSNYNAFHQPQTVTDAAGQTTTYTYNGQGQKLTQTVTRNGQSETTTWNYTGGYLTSITGPVAGAGTSYTYDTMGRVKTVTDSEGYKLTYGYDALNRLIQTVYPDGTYTQVGYNRLDPEWERDRLGRWTHRTYDAVRRLTSVTDPENRTIHYDWCGCGNLEAIRDGKNQATTFTYDVQSRVKTKKYANNLGLTYTYENTTSRLKSILDAKGQTTTHAYNLDNTLASIIYTGAQYPTPNVSYDYSPIYERVTTIGQGTGAPPYSTQYAYGYKPIGTLGANQVATIDGPLANDTVTYDYDELGRVLSSKVNGVGNTVTYDALGRTTIASNPLGSFAYYYVNETRRLDWTSRPYGLKVDYSYYPNIQDQRLSEIKNLGPANTAISKFNYTYNAEGNILDWTQQTGTAAAQIYRMSYNGADELLSAHLRDSVSGAMIKPYTYRYDAAGNRTSEQADGSVNGWGYGNLNQFLSGSFAGGTITVAGKVENEPAMVTIGGQAVAVDMNYNFKAAVAVASGLNAIPITAKDGSGNTTNRTIQFTVNSPARSYGYDSNANLTADGATVYQYDAENRLLVVVYAGMGNRSEFTYDALGRRTQIVEKSNNVVTSTKKFVWMGMNIAEQRDGAGTVTKRYYEEGCVTGPSATPAPSEQFYYVKDHLGSVRGVFFADEMAMNVYQDYDPYGRLTVVPYVDDQPTDISYTGHYYHSRSGLQLAPYRAYSADLGRWLSRDPLDMAEMQVGPNLYSYVLGNPVNLIDPLGLDAQIVIDRDGGRNSPGTLSLYENGKYKGSTRCNVNPYMDGFNGVRKGDYNVLPKIKAGKNDVYPNGQPSITAPAYSNPNSPNYAPGRAGPDYKPDGTVRIHNQSSDGSADSQGCVTVPPDWTKRIWDTMNRQLNNGGTTLRVNYGSQ